MARSIEKVIEETIREMDNASFYDRTFDYEFEEALRDEERFLDWDERFDEETDGSEDEWDDEPVSVDEFYSMKLSRSDMGW